MSTSLVTFDQEEVGQLEAIVSECNLTVLEAQGNFQRTFMLAAGMKRIRDLITAEMMQSIMELQGSGLGFLTDKDKEGGYPLETVKQVTIEATLRGLNMVGNEVNIIAGRFYAAKSGLQRLVKEWPGLTNFRLHLGIPEARNGNTVVDALATWRLDRVEQSLERRGKEAIPVRRNAGMGEDAILGKAKRKMYAAIYELLAGMKSDFPEGEVADALNVSSSPTHPGRSTLNDFTDEKPDAPKDTTLVGDDLKDVLSEYGTTIEGSKTLGEVNAEAKRAAMDNRLPASAKATVQEWGKLRRAEIKGTRGEQSKKPPISSPKATADAKKETAAGGDIPF